MLEKRLTQKQGMSQTKSLMPLRRRQSSHLRTRRSEIASWHLDDDVTHGGDLRSEIGLFRDTQALL